MDNLPKKRFFRWLQTVSLYGTLSQLLFICTKNGKKKRNFCLKQNSILKTMLPHYFFIFVWKWLLPILTKFMIHTWNRKCQNVLSTCISSIVFQVCVSAVLEWDFASPCTSSLPHFLLFSYAEYYSHSHPWSKWCLWLGPSPQYPTQPKHRVYT